MILNQTITSQKGERLLHADRRSRELRQVRLSGALFEPLGDAESRFSGQLQRQSDQPVRLDRLPTSSLSGCLQSLRPGGLGQQGDERLGDDVQAETWEELRTGRNMFEG